MLQCPLPQHLSKSHLKSSRDLLFTLKAKCGANNGICLADTFQELFNFSLSLSVSPPLSLPLSHSVFDLIVAIHFQWLEHLRVVFFRELVSVCGVGTNRPVHG